MEDRRVLDRRDGALEEHVARIAAEFLQGFEAVERIGRPGVGAGPSRDPLYPFTGPSGA